MNKNVIALGLVSFFTDMASSMVTSILPIFIVYVLRNSIDKLGFVVAVATFVSYGFRLLFGYLSDRYHIVKPFVVVGYALSSVTKPMFYFANSWQQIAIFRGVERMGKAIRSSTRDALISSYSGGKSGRAFGLYKMMDMAGEMSGAIVAFAALYFFGRSQGVFRYIFISTIFPGLLAMFIVVLFVKDAPYKKESINFNFTLDRNVLPMLFLYFGFVFFLFNESFFIIKAKESGIKIAYIPLLVILLDLTQILLSFYIGVKVDKLGVKRVISFSFMFGIFSMMSLYFNLVILGFILLGVFIVGSLNAIRSYISDNASNKGTIYGIMYSGVAFFGSAGSVIVGFIWKYFGENTAIVYSIVGLLAIFFVYLIFADKKLGL